MRSYLYLVCVDGKRIDNDEPATNALATADMRMSYWEWETMERNDPAQFNALLASWQEEPVNALKMGAKHGLRTRQ
jgi:hypothetical protein